MEEEDSLSNSSALLFGILGFIVYWWFLRPTPAAPTGTTAATPNGANRTTYTGSRQANRGGWTAAPRVAPKPYLSEAAAEVLKDCQRKPKHVSSSLAVTGLGGSSVLTETGLVAFSHTPASDTSNNNNSSTTTSPEQLRGERAKILTRLLSQKGGTPPSKGSTLVLSISQADMAASESLARILYVLGTFYTVVVILAVSPDEKVEKSALIAQLRGKSHSWLSEDILPNHRIVLATTVTGRVALVRQLSKVSLVVDWDDEVESQLTRFGYQVIQVPNWSKLLD